MDPVIKKDDIVIMETREKDTFDRLMAIPVLRRFQTFFTAHREKLLYLFLGGISFLLSVGSYAVFLNAFPLNELAANFLSWILTVAFVYVANRRWVFEGEQTRGTELRRQVLAFYAGRIATLLVEESIISVFAVSLAFPSVPIKIFAQFIVILLNYIISKKLIFKE